MVKNANKRLQQLRGPGGGEEAGDIKVDEY
jgi:hypothetical protein